MSKTAIFPGSFNPWHDGHTEILRKALEAFDYVIVAVGENPSKETNYGSQNNNPIFRVPEHISGRENVIVASFTGTLVSFAESTNAVAVVRGLRNAADLEGETVQQYWLEDMGLNLPIFYAICDRTTRHISSSAIRAANKARQS